MDLATHADTSCIRLKVQVLSGRGYSFKSLDIVRVIDVLPRQTLADLSRCIERAFDREMDFHRWEFLFGAKRPYDRNALCFGGSDFGGSDDDDGDTPAGAGVSLEQIGLRPRMVFHYLYDFGDDWWHKISVAKLKAPVVEGGSYPRIVESFGQSPKQYYYGEEGESQFVGDDDEDDDDIWEDGESLDSQDAQDAQEPQDAQSGKDGKAGKAGQKS